MTTFQPGCYFDSHLGHYIVPEIIRLAESEGRKLDARMSDVLARYEDDSHLADYPNEAVIEESDAAIQWLNDYHRPEGFWWGWVEGDFGLYELDNDDDIV
jgi:hypothetical protein